MTKQEIGADSVENLGAFERVNRLILAFSAIMVAVELTVIPEAAIVALVAIGVYSGLTAVIGWDPLYGLAKALQHQPPTPTPSMVAVAAKQGGEERSVTSRYDKAA